MSTDIPLSIPLLAVAETAVDAIAQNGDYFIISEDRAYVSVLYSQWYGGGSYYNIMVLQHIHGHPNLVNLDWGRKGEGWKLNFGDPGFFRDVDDRLLEAVKRMRCDEFAGRRPLCGFRDMREIPPQVDVRVRNYHNNLGGLWTYTRRMASATHWR